MILAFADDSSVTAIDDIAQANTYCEVIDVENDVYTFIDEHAAVLRPTFSKSTRRALFGVLTSSDTFALVRTQER